MAARLATLSAPSAFLVRLQCVNLNRPMMSRLMSYARAFMSFNTTFKRAWGWDPFGDVSGNDPGRAGERGRGAAGAAPWKSRRFARASS